MRSTATAMRTYITTHAYALLVCVCVCVCAVMLCWCCCRVMLWCVAITHPCADWPRSITLMHVRFMECVCGA